MPERSREPGGLAETTAGESSSAGPPLTNPALADARAALMALADARVAGSSASLLAKSLESRLKQERKHKNEI